jgi:hypothetical protein
LLALAALQRRKSTMSDGELRRRLQEVNYADSYMYVDRIHTLEIGAVAFGAPVETVLYGESDALLQSLLWVEERQARGGNSVHTIGGSIKTPGARLDKDTWTVGRMLSKFSWLNTIVKFGMYLSRATSFDEMKDPQNCISKYAILNNSIPKNRTDNSYVMGEFPAGFYTFESAARQLPDFVSNMISQYLPGPVGVMNMCPPSGADPATGQLTMWLKDYASKSNFELVIKKLEGVPFPNGACWAPISRTPNDHIRFPRGGVNQVGMTNIRDYTRGGGSGVNDDDSEANPPLIWDKCCAQSCYKPCSDTEKEDGCVTGTWPATFFPRFKFTDVEVATILGLKRAYFSEHILKLIKNMKANNEVYLANITCDPYFLDAIRRNIDFTGLWTNRQPESVPLSYTRDFQSPSGDTLMQMITRVMQAMECKTYYVAYRGYRRGDEFFPGINDRNNVYVSVYKAVRDTDEDQVMQKQGTFGPFSMIRADYMPIPPVPPGTTFAPSDDRTWGWRVVLNSNDIFGDGDNNLLSNRKYFMHEGGRIASSIKLAELQTQYNQLTAKAMPVSHPCTIVGFKFSGVNYELREPKVVTNKVGDPYFPQRTQFNADQYHSKKMYENLNYFILDFGLSMRYASSALPASVKLRNAYVLMPMPSEYDSILSAFNSRSFSTRIVDWLKSWVAADKVEPKTGFPIDKFFQSIFTFSEFDPASRRPKPAYSCSAITSIIRAKLDVDNGPTEETDTGGGQADLQPSQAITDGSDPVWPLFLAVALCIGVILLRKMMGRKK